MNFLFVLKYTTYTSSNLTSVGKSRTSASVRTSPAMYLRLPKISSHLSRQRNSSVTAASYAPCDVANPHLYTPLLMPWYTHSLTSSMAALSASGYRSSSLFVANALNCELRSLMISLLSLLTIVFVCLSHRMGTVNRVPTAAPPMARSYTSRTNVLPKRWSGVQLCDGPPGNEPTPEGPETDAPSVPTKHHPACLSSGSSGLVRCHVGCTDETVMCWVSPLRWSRESVRHAHGHA